MEDELKKIQNEKETWMGEILGHGDKLTDQMNQDWLLLWNTN